MSTNWCIEVNILLSTYSTSINSFLSFNCRVASTLPYFTSNCIYSSSDKLSNIHTVDIYVSTSGLAKTYSTTTVEKSLVPVI